VHTVDREEIFVALAGCARVSLDGQSHDLVPGDTLIVPAGQAFALENPGPEAFEALAVLPVGGRACLPAGTPFSPPWTE
jgi:mannose-6-phosphate isomerase-like protein (cupin superfamily)